MAAATSATAWSPDEHCLQVARHVLGQRQKLASWRRLQSLVRAKQVQHGSGGLPVDSLNGHGLWKACKDHGDTALDGPL